MTFEEDFIVKEKSQTLECQFLLWTLETLSHGGNWTEKTVMEKKKKREEEKIRLAPRSSSKTHCYSLAGLFGADSSVGRDKATILKLIVLVKT